MSCKLATVALRNSVLLSSLPTGLTHQGMDSVLRFTLCCLCPFSGAFCEVLNLDASDIQKLPRLGLEGFLLSLSLSTIFFCLLSWTWRIWGQMNLLFAQWDNINVALHVPAVVQGNPEVGKEARFSPHWTAEGTRDIWSCVL